MLGSGTLEPSSHSLDSWTLPHLLISGTTHFILRKTGRAIARGPFCFARDSISDFFDPFVSSKKCSRLADFLLRFEYVRVKGFRLFLEKAKLFLTRYAKIGQLRAINPTPASNPNSMKTKRNRVVSYLRFTASSAFFAAAAAFTLVAATTNVLTTPDDSAATAPHRPTLKSTAQDSVKGVAREKSEKNGSLAAGAAAIEEYSKRAYPAIGISLDQTMNAIVGLKRFTAVSASNATPTPAGKGQPGKKSRKSPPETPRFNNWSSLGSTNAPFPGILTFSGAPYVTSGRITALAVDRASGCTASFCRLWVAAAGGGVWRTTNALAPTPTWTFLTSLNFSTNAIGTMTYDNTFGVLYVGTGEPNASADSEAGLGIFKSTNGGDTWSQLPSQIGPITTTSPGSAGGFPNNGTYTGNAFFGRSIGQIVLDPTNPAIIYVSSARGVRGVDSTYGGPTSNPPAPRPPFGLFKSTDFGQHFSFIWDGGNGCPGNCNGTNALSSIRGVTDVRLDPSNNNIIYAATFANGNAGSGGVWRSNDGGVTWTQILTARNSAFTDDRPAFDVANLGGGNTLLIAAVGNEGTPTAHVFRTLAAQTGAPAFTDQTAAENPAGQSDDYCTGQCWYDNYVVIPPEANNIVYVGGSYSYGSYSGATNGRAVIASQDTGNSWFDFTWDATNAGGGGPSCCNPAAGIAEPNGMHPDSHALATLPGLPIFFFAGSDGGLVRSVSGYSNITSQCTSRIGLTIFTLADFNLCNQLLQAVPNLVESMNAGLDTLQFHSLSVASDNLFHVQGGTQDNGTFETYGSLTWPQEIYGDGAQSGFSVTNSNRRFNTFFFQAHDANFQNGNPTAWVIISGPIFSSPEGSLFAPPIIADPNPAAANTIFEGSLHIWRTQDWGGSQAFLEANCPEFTTSAANPACGDFVTLGGAAGTNDQGCLPCGFWGNRTGGAVNVIERTTADTSTAWAASQGGRVFITTNADTNPATNVIWNRLDAFNGVTLAANSPGRVPTGIAINPANTFQAWVSYSGYSAVTPGQPGHIFKVTWTGAGNATWTNISSNLPDIPLTSVVYDPVTGDLYASSDFIVFRLKPNQQVNPQIWDIAGLGMPLVEVPKLTIMPGPTTGTAFLYAATHGLGAWRLPLYGR